MESMHETGKAPQLKLPALNGTVRSESPDREARSSELDEDPTQAQHAQIVCDSNKAEGCVVQPGDDELTRLRAENFKTQRVLSQSHGKASDLIKALIARREQFIASKAQRGKNDGDGNDRQLEDLQSLQALIVRLGQLVDSKNSNVAKGADGQGDECPTCGRRTSDQHTVEALQEKLQNMEEESEEAYAERFKLMREASRLRDELAKKRLAELGLNTRVEELSVELQDKKAQLAAQIKAMEEKDAALMEFVAKLREQESDLAELRTEKATLVAKAALVSGDGGGMAVEEVPDEELTKVMSSNSTQTDSARNSAGTQTATFTPPKPKRPSSLARCLWALLVLVLISAMMVMAFLGGMHVSVQMRNLALPPAMVVPPGLELVPVAPDVQATTEAPAWAGRKSTMKRLEPGGPGLRPGEYITSCEEEECVNPLFLWMQRDGNLVLYRGRSPTDHRGPLWASNTILRHSREAMEWRADVTAVLDRKRNLRLLDEHRRTIWRKRPIALPSMLYPWPLGAEPPALLTTLESVKDQGPLGTLLRAVIRRAVTLADLVQS